jgi:hypothetical protein
LSRGTPKGETALAVTSTSAGAVDHLAQSWEKCQKMDTKQNRERFFVRALEYERLAQDTLDPIAQKTYRDMARQWRELAEQAPDLPDLR